MLMVHHLDRLERGEIKRLLILAPPGSAKSTYSGIQFPVKHLCYNPHENIICASNTQDLATGFNRRRLNAALSPEWMTLSSTKLDKNMQSMEHFGTESQGSIKAVGVTTSVVGNRSHLNILDDPIRGMEEAYNPTTLEKQWDWFNNEFRTRLVPEGKELIVSTRWARKDIAGRIIERVEAGEEDWTVLRLPMLADKLDDPMGRALGESLWPEYFDAKFIEEKRRSPLLWATQYQQTPLDEKGTWIDYDKIILEDHPGRETELKYVIAMDLAHTLGRGDFTVIVVAGVDCFRRLHIIHVDRERTNAAETVNRLTDLCRIYAPSEVLVDDDNASKVFAAYVVESFRNGIQKGSMPPISMQPIRGQNKEARATAIRALFITDQVRIVKAKWNNDLIRECLEFPSGEHDDIIDSLSLIGRRMHMLSSPRKPMHLSGEDPQKNQTIRIVDGVPKLNIPFNELFEQREATRRRRQRI
jgi:predicted phage terminase large subunit-like protein